MQSEPVRVLRRQATELCRGPYAEGSGWDMWLLSLQGVGMGVLNSKLVGLKLQDTLESGWGRGLPKLQNPRVRLGGKGPEMTFRKAAARGMCNECTDR